MTTILRSAECIPALFSEPAWLNVDSLTIFVHLLGVTGRAVG